MDILKTLEQYHLTIFQFSSGDSIDRMMIYNAQSQLDSLITGKSSNTAIDLWIESGGGDAHAAYKLIVDLRSRCSRLRVIVPDYAKSAATLIALGADEIFMSPASELGPLDVQIAHPDREMDRTSGLDVASSYDFLGELAITLIVSGGGSIVSNTGLTRKEVLRETVQFVANFLEPSVARLDPYIVSRAKRQLEVAQRYATKMLMQRNVPDEFKLSQYAAEQLVKKLINDYPVHEFVIVPEEARELGLPISDITEHPNWNHMKVVYKWLEANGQSQLKLLNNEQLEELATRILNMGDTPDSEGEDENHEQQTNNTNTKEE